MALYTRIRNTLIHAVERFAEVQALSWINTRRYDVVFASLLGLSVLGASRLCFLRPIASSNIFAEPQTLEHSEKSQAYAPGTSSHQRISLLPPSNTVIIKRLTEPISVSRILIHTADVAFSAWMWLIVNEHQYGGRIEAPGELDPVTANRERLSFFAELFGCAIAKSGLTALQLYLDGKMFSREIKRGLFSAEEESKLHSSRMWRAFLTCVPSIVALSSVITLYEPGAATAAVENKPLVPASAE